ncbi:hypothetical protein ACHAQE_002074 [Botrytis cinerea]
MSSSQIPSKSNESQSARNTSNHSPPFHFEDTKTEPIAVIGFSFKFPEQATSPQGFWEMLVEKRNVMTELPKDRGNIDAFHRLDSRKDAVNFRGGHFVTAPLGCFDAPFFTTSAAEAVAMDPMHRFALESAYHALENAGLPIEKVSGTKTSVFAGCFTNDYYQNLTKDLAKLPTYGATGVASSMLASRLSWFFNFHGPSVNLDSACSSSMMAFDLAVKSLQNGDSDMSLVTGANLIVGIEFLALALSMMNFFSKDSRSYSFDHRANGYGRGEGVGVIVLKRLSDALRDGDTIRAVVRSTASNQDGYTPGITLPSRASQEKLIHDAYLRAGLDFNTTRYVEAHGTGTPAGDPIEASAIGRTFRKYRSTDCPIYIGAVKSNIGHLEGASGIAGIIKTILILEAGIIPPNANYERTNPDIDEEFLRIKFPRECTPWPCEGLRRASINSFGFGGSNSHVVIEDAYHFLKRRGLHGNHVTAPSPADFDGLRTLPKPSVLLQAGKSRNNGLYNGAANVKDDSTTYGVNGVAMPHFLLWSSADKAGLERLGSAYSSYFRERKMALAEENAQSYLGCLANTLLNRRSSLPWKSFAVVNSIEELNEISSILSIPIRTKDAPRLGYIFTGQGAQFAEMGVGLLIYPVFEKSLEASEKYLTDFGCQWLLRDELKKAKDVSNVNKPEYSQVLCTALQIALIDLLRSFDTAPLAVVGHSSGEIAAAYCIGGLSQKSACKVAYFRGQHVARLVTSGQSHGTMISVGLSEEVTNRYIQNLFGSLSETLVVACINSPENVTVSGDEVSIEILKANLDKDSIFNRKLAVNVAYHSSQMNTIAADYLESLGILESGDSSYNKITMISSVTTKVVSPADLQKAEYWVDNLTSPVRFSNALAKICISGSLGTQKLGIKHASMSITDILEIGPHSTLQGPIKALLKKLKVDITYSSCMVRTLPAPNCFAQAMGQLWCHGYKIDVMKTSGSEGMQPRMTLPDLPQYPFDHSKQYWHESRLSKGLRFRKQARLDLLGAPDVNWNPMEARWRNYLRVSEQPWIEDHKITGSTVYPAGGMLVMALEAAKQMADPQRKIHSFTITDTTIKAPIPVPSDSDGVETEIYLRPTEINGKIFARFQFELCSYVNDNWSENCRGIVQVEYESPPDEIDSGRQSESMSSHYQRLIEDERLLCNNTLDSKKAYSYMNSIGLCYGPLFHTLENISYSHHGTAVGQVRAFQQETLDSFQIPVIHPVTLDALLHLNMVAISQGGEKTIPTLMPTRVGKLWISSSGISFPSRESVDVFGKSSMTGYRKAGALLFALDKKTKDLLLLFEDVEATTVATVEPVTNDDVEYKMSYNMVLKPDVGVLSNEQLMLYCGIGRPFVESKRDLFQDIGHLILITISKASRIINDGATISSQPHISRYIQWLKDQLARFQSRSLPHLPYDAANWKMLEEQPELQSTLSARVQASKMGKFYSEICQNLMDMLLGNLDPLTFMFEDDLVSEFYRNAHENMNMHLFVRYLDAMYHNNPNVKILEIGAGTGAITEYVVDAFSTKEISGQGILNCDRYDYTDISPAFFDAASTKFSRHGDKMRYKVLDVERDPSAQGFEEATYDFIVAAYVIHATKNLAATMRHIRKLLKPNGKILISETTKDAIRIRFAFGLLPGWWLGEENYRQNGAAISIEEWDALLKETGFSGVDIELPDYEDEACQEQSIFISTAVCDVANGTQKQLSKAIKFPKVSIVIREDNHFQQSLARELKKHLEASEPQKEFTVSSFDHISELEDLEKTFCIVLVESEEPILYDCAETAWASVKKILTTVPGAIWVTGSGASPHDPKFNLMDGLSRVARGEYPELVLVTVGLENACHSISTSASNILAVFRNSMEYGPTGDFESEYVQKDGFLQVPRVVQANYLNFEVENRISTNRTTTQTFGAGTPLELSIRSPGLLDSLRFIEDAIYPTPLAPGEIEIKVEATGVNFRDCLTALGQMDTKVFGIECAGVVTRVTEGSGFLIGDHVLCAFVNTYRSYARGSSKFAAKIPEGMSFAEASALPVVFMTAWHTLHDIANLQAGETVLIHAGAGGTGQAAIQVAQLLGAEVYTTVGSKEKKELLMKHYNIPGDRILYSRNTSFAQGIKNLTNNRGVDVVLNSLSGDMLLASWDCVAPFGRFIEIGKQDILSRSNLPMGQFSQPKTFSSIDLLPLAQKRPDIAKRALQTVVKLIDEKKLHVPQPFNIYGISEIEKVLRLFQSGRNLGKMAIELRNNDSVQAILPRKADYEFEKNATYLIAGGLGGLGRTIALWMVSRGARHLILLGRSGISSEAAISLVKKLESMGVQVDAQPCDISNRTSLQKTLDRCHLSMPPIKGCIAGAMMLRDHILEDTTTEDWNLSLNAKVQGSWNLHTMLPQDLEFFICLSSTCGVLGGLAAASYAAGNSYLDALAQFRVQSGLKAVSLVLGWMKSAGVVAENAALEGIVRMSGSLRPISQTEFYALLDYYCNPNLQLCNTETCRVIIGIETPAVMRANLVSLPHWTTRRTFRFMHQIGLDTSSLATGATEVINYADLFREAQSLDEAAEIATEALIQKLSKALSVAVDDIDKDKALHAYGVDSLLAVELRNLFNKEFGAEIPIFDIVGGASFNDVGKTVAQKSKNLQLT